MQYLHNLCIPDQQEISMKKLFASIAMALCCASTTAATVPQTVQFVWPFNAGGMGVMARSLMDIANQQQSKYQFVFTIRPGAGGTVAANYVLSQPSLTVFANSDGHYTRPLMYNESHDPEQFKLVSTICLNIPMAIYSRKYTNINEVKNKDFTVGIIPGTATQLFTRILSKNNPEFKFTDVPYKGITDSTMDMLAKHIDGNVSFVGVSSLARMPSDVTVLGITGSRSFPGLPTFDSQKIKGVNNLTNGYYVFVPRSVDASVAQELNRIFTNAANSDAFKEVCANERGTVEPVQFNQTEKLHKDNIKEWQQAAQGIVKQ